MEGAVRWMRLMAVLLAVAALAGLSVPAGAVTASDILNKVKAAEAGVRDFRADMVIGEANKKAVSGMGEGYGDFLRLEKGVVSYKKPDKIRYDGYAHGIKAAYIQNGYFKLIIAPMIKQKLNVKNQPGQRQDTLDLGFLSSRLWVDNYVSVVSTGRDGIVKLKFDPKFGDNDKRHDMVWLDPKTLRILKREKYLGGGELRVKNVYTGFAKLGGKLPIAVYSEMFDPKGRSLGTVEYRNLKVNTGLGDALFSLTQR